MTSKLDFFLELSFSVMLETITKLGYYYYYYTLGGGDHFS